MQEVTFVINLRKSGALREMLDLFNGSPIMKWPLTLNNDKSKPSELFDWDISTTEHHYSNESVIYVANAPSSRIGFIPWGEDNDSEISERATGTLLLKLEATAVLDNEMSIVRITGNSIFNKVITQLITKPSFNYWRGGICDTGPDMLVGLDNTELKATLANMVECAISGDPAFLNIAIAYLLVGYSLGEHITNPGYIEEALEQAKCLGIVGDNI